MWVPLTSVKVTGIHGTACASKERSRGSGLGSQGDARLTPKIGGGRNVDRDRDRLGGRRPNRPRGARILDRSMRGAWGVGEKEVGVGRGCVSSRKLPSCPGW